MQSESMPARPCKERITDYAPQGLLTRRAHGWLDRWMKRSVLRLAERLRHGALSIQDGDEMLHFGDSATATDLQATVQVLDSRFYRAVGLGGSTGAGEAYREGWWRCDDLAGLVRIIVRNTDLFYGIDSGWGRLTEPFHRLFHFLHRNTLAGSRKNIAAHYDLGNDFYRLFLDETMNYSSAYFTEPDMSLEAASTEKMERLCRQLALRPEDHLLEIGTGWGGLALHAATRYGCRVTTTTISAEQYAHARAEVERCGLSEQITVLFSDYRDLRGSFDKIVSVEMLEAVGHAYFPVFFQQCARLLRPDGLMALQTITIKDQQYEASKNYVDFVKRYIFPGGCLPSVTALSRVMTRYTDLGMLHCESFGQHYATTLRLWRARFMAQRDVVARLGYDASFQRLWEFYLAYCEGAFAERHINVVQMLLARPDYRQDGA